MPMPIDTESLGSRLTQAGLRLNREQQTAVACLAGPVQVVAGPGSGKTRVITARTGALLWAGIDPSAILVLTFTKAAGVEMRERIAALPGLHDQVKRLVVGTFHSLCFRLLRNYGPTPRLANENQQRKWLERALQDNDEEIRSDLIAELLKQISAAKNRRQQFRDLPRAEKLLRNIWAAYEQAKAEAGLMDYDDLLLETCDLLETNQSVLQSLQGRFQYVLLDEFQDTSPVQYRLVQLLAAPENNLCVVGDIDQAIYAWRAASPELLLQFRRDYPTAAVITLRQNYRSVPTIIQASNRLISHNQQRYALTVESVRRGGSEPRLLTPANEWAEAKSILTMLRSEQNRGVPLGEMAVFYRTNNQARPLVSLLVEQDIPFSIRDNNRLGLDHWVVQESHAFLRLLADRDDLESFIHVGRRQLRLSEQAILELRRICHLGQIAPWQAVRHLPVDMVELSKVEQLRLHLDHACRLSPAQALGYYLKQMGFAAYLEWYAQHRGYENDAFVSICDDLRLDLRRFTDTAAYLQHIDKLTSVVVQPVTDPTEALNLTTLHGAKGLEFRIVWIIDVVDGLLPHRLSETAEQLEEERRLFYVGLTRAKDRLYLFSPNSYRGQDAQLSPFLAEAGFIVEPQPATRATQDAKENPRPVAGASPVAATVAHSAVAPFLGMQVVHNTLGPGLVVGLAQDISQGQPFHLVTIDFATRNGVKLHWEYCLQESILTLG